MKLAHFSERPDWRERMEALGFVYHSYDGLYWMDRLGVELSEAEHAELGRASLDVHRLGLDIVADACHSGDFAPWALPDIACRLIAESWERRDPALYGRFDFTLDGRGRAKAYEYNADTPTSIMEGGRASGDWARARGLRDASSMGEAMPRAFAALRSLGCEKMAIAGLSSSVEDTANLFPMVDWAARAGIEASWRPFEDLEHDPNLRVHGFDGEHFDWIFKLYPWEQLALPGAEHLLSTRTRFVEPAWKLLLSSKAFMALAWEREPGHPNLLPCYFEGATGPGLEAGYARKPLYSREGANIQIVDAQGRISQSEIGPYGREGHVLQAFCPMRELEPGKLFTLGGWVCGSEFGGAIARFADSQVVTNTSWTCGCYVAD